MISRIIHQIWYQGFENLPDRFKNNVQSIIDKNPGYKIYHWDEISIRQELSRLDPKYLAKLDEFKLLHQKIDLFRYLALWLYGGVSVDTDVLALKGFDTIPNINTSNLIVSYNSSNEFENYIKNGQSISLNNATILSSPNNPILYGLIEHILGLSCDLSMSKEKCVQSTTGPIEFTNYLNQYKDQITILPNVYLEPCGGSDPYCEINSQLSVLNHLHEGSWIRPSHRNIGKVWFHIKHYRVAIFIVIIGLIILFVSTSKTKIIS